MRSALAATLLALLALAAPLGCSSEPTDETPVGALTLFLEAMQKSDWEASALEDAYQLLSPAAREALEERATRANTLSRRDLAPSEMLVQGRFRLRFTPRPGGMQARIEGDRATVTVLGRREGERADVPMILEGGRWRVDLILPPVGGG